MFEIVRAKTMHTFGVPPYLSGFVCAFHSAAPGSTPKHAIYTFFNYSQICARFIHAMWEKNENKQKRGRVWPIFYKKNTLNNEHGILSSEQRFTL